MLLLLLILLIRLHLLLQVAIVEEADTCDHECNDKDKKKEGECTGGATFEFARVTIEHRTALALSLLADATVFTMWITFLCLEANGFLDD